MISYFKAIIVSGGIYEKKQLFGRRLKAIREGKGLTQEYVAEQVYISPNYVSGIERGTENPTFNVLLKLGDVPASCYFMKNTVIITV